MEITFFAKMAGSARLCSHELFTFSMPSFEKAADSKPQMFSVTIFQLPESSLKVCRNPCSRVQLEGRVQHLR